MLILHENAVQWQIEDQNWLKISPDILEQK